MKNSLFLFALIIGASCVNSSNDAKSLFEDGKYDEAIAIYDKQLEVSKSLEIQYNRARAFEEKGDQRTAELEYIKILETNPEYLPAKLSLSKIAYEKKEYIRSIMLSGDAMRINESSYMAHYLQARAKHQLGYLESAMEGYDMAISLNKEFGESYLYRGYLLRQSMKHKSACEDFKLAEVLNVKGAKQAVKKYCR